MKISASKKQLAKIISENGGWRDGAEFAAQDQDGDVFFYTAKPTRSGGWWLHDGRLCGVCIVSDEVLPNWHQAIVSRDEYFHLYPAPDADVPSGDGVTDDTATLQRILDCSRRAATIEQLAAEYRNRQDYAERKKQEADAAKAEAEAALSRLIIACADLGFEIKPKGKLESSGASVIDKLQYKASALAGSGLNITDWRGLRVGDEIATTSGRKLTVTGLRQHDESWPIDADDEDGSEWCVSANDWRFIRRPSKEADNA